jgi:hypothetical protein
MFLEFFRFDLRFQRRAPLLWVVALVFALLAFGATTSNTVTVGGSVGNVHKNAPVVIVNMMMVFTILGMFVTTTFVASPLLRDFELGTSDLFFATPMRKRDYFLGRFAAATVACMGIFVLVALAMILGSRMPWVDAARMGPFSLTPYLWALVVFVLPNLLFLGALLSLLAVTTRSLLMVYLGVIAFFVLYAVSANLMKDLQSEWLGTLLDPFGGAAMARSTRYWSSLESNILLPPLRGAFLANRLFWTAAGLAVLALALALFKPQRTGTGKAWFRKATLPALAAVAPIQVKVPPCQRRFGAAAAWTQFLHLLRFDTKSVLKGVPFLILLAFGVANLVGALIFVGTMYGTKVYPVTFLMLESMEGSFSFLLVFVMAFYAGELVWKARAAKLGEVTDALPVPNWVPLLAKVGALIAVVFAFLTMGGITCILFQLLRGYHHLELGLYVKGILLQSVGFILFGCLAMVIQVLVDNKFLGYLGIILVLLASMVLDMLNLQHNLYQFAGAPAVIYSDMNHYGHFLAGRLWFNLYWSLFTGLLLILASVFWSRGTAATFRSRLRQAHGLPGRLLTASLALVVAFAATGGWIFYNTNILNKYVPTDRRMDLQAEYEKKYVQYKNLPQPCITEVTAAVDIFPAERRVAIRGRYLLQNQTSQPITDLHLALDPEAALGKLSFGEAALTLRDDRHGYRIYRLATPLAPQASLAFEFEVSRAHQGFTNAGGPTTLNENGTFFNNAEFFPHFGYQADGQLVDRNERRKRGLGPVPRMATLEDQSARNRTYIAQDANWIKFDTTVSTSADQVALAPGYLQKEWTEGGRRYFHYRMDAPMMPFFAYLSARWQVKRAVWHDLPIEIYYDPGHAYNVDRMITSVQKSLDYFTANFAPYQHKQVRILEFPRYERFAQSFANTIPFSESIGFIADLRKADDLDYVFTVTSHEVAHQWWAHQVIGGNQQGSTMLSEALAEYSSLMVTQKEYGKAMMRRSLKYELDRYLRGRRTELVEEQPLFRVENQTYIHYPKGALVFYRLQEEIGEANLNRALAAFLKDKAFQPPPFTTSQELLTYLRRETPADKQDLVTDLFERIVFYDNRVTAATARKLADGKYEVALTYEAKKLQVEGQGAETPRKLEEWLDVGVFGRKKGAPESTEKVLYFQKHLVTAAKGTITVTVDSLPYDAGLDPYNKLIDRVADDNRKVVTLTDR